MSFSDAIQQSLRFGEQIDSLIVVEQKNLENLPIEQQLQVNVNLSDYNSVQAAVTRLEKLEKKIVLQMNQFKKEDPAKYSSLKDSLDIARRKRKELSRELRSMK